MNEILSPDQIAELVAAARNGDLPAAQAAPARRTRRVRTIDFSRPTKLSLIEQRQFERAHATFCRSASVRLSTELRAPIELEIINFSQLTWATALRELPHPSIFATALLSPLETRVAICLEQALVFRLVERLIGGEGATQIDRALTDIELALARRIYGSLVGTLSLVWQELLGLSMSLLELETQIAQLQLVAASEPTLVLTIELREPGASATISLLVPHSSIAAAGKALGGARAEQPPPDRPLADTVGSSLAGVEVEVRAEVGALELTIGEVLGIAEGDVLHFGAGNEGVYLAGQRLSRIRPGRSGSSRAVQVLDPAAGTT